MSEMKRVLLAIFLCVAAIVAIEALFPAPPPVAPVVPAPEETRIDPPGPQVPANGTPNPPPVPPVEGSELVPPPPPEPPPFEPQALQSGRVITTVRPRGGSLGGIVLKEMLAEPGGDRANPADWLTLAPEPPADAPGPLGVTLLSRDMALPDLESRNWTLLSAPGETPIVLETVVVPAGVDPARGGLRVTRTLEPSTLPGSWLLHMKVDIRTENPDLAGQEMRLRVRGPALMVAPVENIRDLLQGWTLVRNRALHVTTGSAVASGIEDKEPVRDEGEILWTGAGTTYFAAVLRPVSGDAAGGAPVVGEVEWSAIKPPVDPRHGPGLPHPSPLLVLAGRAPAPGTVVTHEFEFFAGPKSDEVLTDAAYSVYAPVRVHGFFGIIEEGLFLLLRAFHFIVPNWGVCIILLTLVVRAALHPLSRKQLRSTIEYGEKMKKFKPKLDALKKKYEKNREKLQSEQMRLMKEEGIPLMPGGCLLTLLQIPIWFALYGMLQSHFDLRHAPFLWIQDLSMDDRLWALPRAAADIWMVPDHLNVLPLLMTASWFFASKATMTPPTDEQQAQMQKMMQWMPFIMLLFPGFYTMPAGLCLYITVSSSWGIAESYYIRKKMGV